MNNQILLSAKPVAMTLNTYGIIIVMILGIGVFFVFGGLILDNKNDKDLFVFSFGLLCLVVGTILLYVSPPATKYQMKYSDGTVKSGLEFIKEEEEKREKEMEFGYKFLNVIKGEPYNIYEVFVQVKGKERNKRVKVIFTNDNNKIGTFEEKRFNIDVDNEIIVVDGILYIKKPK